MTVRLFDGSDYVPAIDDERLCGQIARVWDAMATGQWLTLSEIADVTNDPPAKLGEGEP